MKWEVVIGLEIHCQLNTKTKLFCGCQTSFGESPNVNTCPVCLGHPGVLPVLNVLALKKAIMAGHALGSQVEHFSKFDRKNYFYPDLPKAYQITQYEKPICTAGQVEIFINEKGKNPYSKNIGITRIHIEEDAGKLIHSHVAGLTESYVDLNRAGTPLIEIVSEPDLSSATEAVTYLQKIKTILEYIGVSDCNMEEGSLRCDANVSLKKVGEKKLGNRTEIKNMNTFKGLQSAIEYEIHRQQKILDTGGVIVTETLLFDSVEKKTRSMRSKEESHDYRYFPEPDLLPFQLEETYINDLRKTLPELPDAKKKRFMEQYNLSEYDSDVLVSDQAVANYYEKAVSFCPEEPKKVCNWIMTEVLSILNDELLSIEEFSVTPENIGELIKMVSTGELTGKIAKDIFPEMVSSRKTPKDIIQKKGIKVMSDDSELKKIVSEIIKENPEVVTKYQNGNQKVFGFLVGQIMKKTKGQANPSGVNKLLKEML